MEDFHGGNSAAFAGPFVVGGGFGRVIAYLHLTSGRSEQDLEREPGSIWLPLVFLGLAREEPPMPAK